MFKKKIWLPIIIVILLGAALCTFFVYKVIFIANTKTNGKATYVYIPTGSNFDDVVNILNKEKILINPKTFITCARWIKYTDLVKPGKYKIQDKMTNLGLARMLRAGNQVPVKLTFNNIRLKSQFAGRIASQIEVDSLELFQILNDGEFLKKYDLTPETALTMFIPNTYQFFWNTSAEDFVERMKKEYDKFWNQERLAKAQNILLTPTEVGILASIIDQETNKKDDKPYIASVYINRLHKGMELGACPTVKYAIGDFTIQRVLNKHLEVVSPYNTYKNKGLPPGPICMPSISSIDAVLNSPKTDYLFFCAKDDFSGYHVFTSSDVEHMRNANKFQAELNRRGIRK